MPNLTHILEERDREFEGRFGHFWSKDGPTGDVYGGPIRDKWIVVDKEGVINFIQQDRIAVLEGIQHEIQNVVNEGGWTGPLHLIEKIQLRLSSLKPKE